MQSVLKSKKRCKNEAINCLLQKLKITESTLPIEMSILLPHNRILRSIESPARTMFESPVNFKVETKVNK